MRRNNGQGIVEYTAVIAFVGLLIALVFSFAQNTLFASVSGAYSGVNSTLQAQNSAVHNANM